MGFNTAEYTKLIGMISDSVHIAIPLLTNYHISMLVSYQRPHQTERTNRYESPAIFY